MPPPYAQPPPQAQMGVVSSGSCGRVPARLCLEESVMRLRRRADHIQTISNAMPAVLSPEQDEALWHVARALEAHI